MLILLQFGNGFESSPSREIDLSITRRSKRFKLLPQLELQVSLDENPRSGDASAIRRAVLGSGEIEIYSRVLAGNNFSFNFISPRICFRLSSPQFVSLSAGCLAGRKKEGPA